jgi:hypothetical protein
VPDDEPAIAADNPPPEQKPPSGLKKQPGRPPPPPTIWTTYESSRARDNPHPTRTAIQDAVRKVIRRKAK